MRRAGFIDEAAKHALANLKGTKELLELTKEWASKLDAIKLFSESHDLMPADLDDIARFATNLDALGTDATQVARATQAARLLQGLSIGVNATAIVGDAVTLISPEDKGAMGWVDRGAALANGALAGAGIAEMLGVELAIPEPAGGIVMAGTGIYLAADYMYHHWKWFHNRVDDVGDAAADVGKDVAKGAVAVYQGTVRDATATATAVAGAANAVANAGGDAVNAIKHLF